MSLRRCLARVTILACIAGVLAQASMEQNKNNSIIPEDLLPNDNEIVDEYPNVLSVKFHLRSQRVPELLTKIALYETECPIKQCSVSLIDIAEAIQVDKFNNDDIANAIGIMNISRRDAFNIFLLYDLNVTSIENLLSEAGTTFSGLYKSFVDSLSSPAETVPKILETLNVSVSDFTNAQAYGNDTVRLQVLSTGDYSYKNIETVLNITNKTGIDILKTLPINTILKKSRNFDSDQFTSFVKNVGISSSKLASFYNYLNVTSINFIAYPGFMQLWTDFDNYLNPEEVLATVTSDTTIVTSSKAKSLMTFQTQNSEFVRNYSYYQAENIVNPLVHYHIKNVLLNNPEYISDDIAVIQLYNAYTGNITEISTKYNSSKLFNCTYVTKLPYGEIHVEYFTAVDVKGNLLALTKSNLTIYNLGSPLFCQNKLAGIASKNDTREIEFSTFMKKSGVTPKPPGQISTSTPVTYSTTINTVTVSEPGAGSRITGNLLYVILMVTGLKVLLF